MEQDFEKTQAEILSTDIETNPYLSETPLYSTNKGLKTNKKNVIAAINELTEALGSIYDEHMKLLELLGDLIKDDRLQELIDAKNEDASISIFKKAKKFQTMHDVINEHELTEGDYVRTLGYNEPYDGGTAVYKITATNENCPWAIKLRCGLFACIMSLPHTN